MPLFEMTPERLTRIEQTSLADHDLHERQDLQRLLRNHIEEVLPGHLLIAEEFSNWTEGHRRIDLLAVDTDANLVVIELKRNDTGAHMELQAIRYAAMVSRMRFEEAVAARAQFRKQSIEQAENDLLNHLEWDEPSESDFAARVRIVLIAADFSSELATSVLWLNDQGALDISCVRLRPHQLDGRILLDIQTLIPLPEASNYIIRTQRKSQAEQAEKDNRQWTGYWFVNTGDSGDNDRAWEDQRRYGYMAAGNGEPWRRQIQKLEVGQHVLAYLSKHGYVGVGQVIEAAVRMDQFIPDGQELPLTKLEMVKPPHRKNAELMDWCARIQWVATKSRDEAVKATPLPNTAGKLRQPELVKEVLAAFDLQFRDANED